MFEIRTSQKFLNKGRMIAKTVQLAAELGCRIDPICELQNSQVPDQWVCTKCTSLLYNGAIVGYTRSPMMWTPDLAHPYLMAAQGWDSLGMSRMYNWLKWLKANGPYTVQPVGATAMLVPPLDLFGLENAYAAVSRPQS